MATHLQVGDKAPAFSGVDQNENKISLSNFKGQKVVLFFYPEDDTPTFESSLIKVKIFTWEFGVVNLSKSS